MLEVGPVSNSIPDLLRLVVVPVLAWASIQDLRTRRVPNAIWPPLAVLGLLLLAIDTYGYAMAGGIIWNRFLVGAGISLFLVIPLAYGFWLLRGFGGADAKALIVLAVLFPVYPTYEIGALAFPLYEAAAGSFALTILTNAVVVGILYPVGLAGYNLLSGNRARVMVLGRPRSWRDLGRAHGRLLETESGFTRGGLDLDALRMYCRWRGVSLEDIRERPEELRDPASLPADPNPPTDGAVDAGDTVLTDGGDAGDPSSKSGAAADYDDPWGALEFLDSIEGSAYGTTPEQLRTGLELVASRERIWVSPGIPFILPLFAGLLVALVYGDLFVGAMLALGIM